MFIDYKHPSVFLNGRFSELNKAAVATATGSSIYIAFKGEEIILHFDTSHMQSARPHIYMVLDGGAFIESAIDDYLRVYANDAGEHVLWIIYKGGMEIAHRWYQPLQGKLAFKGAEVADIAELPKDDRKTIEFVGDSITEGVLIDASYAPNKNEDQQNRAFQDDVTATYAWLTAKALGLRSLHMGYGAVGVTKSGCGSVPKAADAYPYCFDRHPVRYEDPDFILINHGANDHGAGVDRYIAEYEHLLDVIRELRPTSRIISTCCFRGHFKVELEAMINKYNEKHGTDIVYIDASSWVPYDPIHPLRDGHRIIAENLAPILKEKLGL